MSQIRTEFEKAFGVEFNQNEIGGPKWHPALWAALWAMERCAKLSESYIHQDKPIIVGGDIAYTIRQLSKDLDQ